MINTLRKSAILPDSAIFDTRKPSNDVIQTPCCTHFSRLYTTTNVTAHAQSRELVYDRFILIQGSQIFGRTWKQSNKPIRYANIKDVKEQNNNVNLVKYRLIFTLEKTEKNLKNDNKKTVGEKNAISQIHADLRGRGSIT